MVHRRGLWKKYPTGWETLSFNAEFKYDGQRAQIHAIRDTTNNGITVKIFSRHLEDIDLRLIFI